MTSRVTTILAAAITLAGASWAQAQQQPAPQDKPSITKQAEQVARDAKPISKVNMVKINATIQAIDTTARTVTLRDEMGNEDVYTVSKDMQRFNELKVGQKVGITYYESLVLQVLQPGEKGSGTSFEAALNRAKSQLPAGTLATQDKTTVTVKAIDPTVPSVTVTTDDGRTVTRKIEDKTILDKVKPGDRVDITFTRALITEVQ
jgi:Cu/Ag efflux protein CusF